MQASCVMMGLSFLSLLSLGLENLVVKQEIWRYTLAAYMSTTRLRSGKRNVAATQKLDRERASGDLPVYQRSQQWIQVKPFLVAWCVYLLLMELFGAGFIRTDTPLDFQLFYTSGYQARTHPSQIYDLTQQVRIQHAITSKKSFLPFYHPSYEALLYAPFSLLRYRSAYFAFIAFNMLMLLAAFLAARPAFSSVIPWLQPRPGLMFFLFLPVFTVVIFGQDSFLALLLCCLTWRQLDSGKDVSAGCFLALALFKFQIVIPIAVLIALRRGRRFTGGFIVTAAAVTLLSAGIVGRTGVAAWVRLLHGSAALMNHTALAGQKVLEVPLAMPNLAGLLYACGARLLQSPIVFNAFIGVCALGLFAWCAWAVRKCELKVAFSIAILCGLMVSYHLYIYDLTLCLLPVSLLAGRTHWCILLGLFGLPFILVPFGLTRFFLLAVPVLAMLIYTILSTAKPVTSHLDHALSTSV